MILDETFGVEGKDSRGRWCLIGIAEEGRQLNPCATIDEAKSLLADLKEAKKSVELFGWISFQIVKTTREIVS